MSSPNLESCPNELSKFGAHLERLSADGPLTNPEFLKWSPKLVSPNMLSKNNLLFVTLQPYTVILTTP